MAFKFSEIIDPIEPPRKGSEFSEKMGDLPVGKAFIVTGMSQGNLSSRVHQFKMRNPGLNFKTDNLKDGRFQVTRIA